MSRILWVDDDYQMTKGLIRPLERARYEVDSVDSIPSAVKKLRSDREYELAIMDIILPLDASESVRASLPESIQSSLDAGNYAGEGLIDYIRFDLELRIPIVVMSVIAYDSALRSRLEPYEISAFLTKGRLSPRQVKETVERVLDEPNLERAVVLNLRSKRREVRRAGLVHAAQMKPSPKLRRALLALASVEIDSELCDLVSSILEDHPLVEEQLSLNNEEMSYPTEESPPAEYDVFLSHHAADKPAVETLAHKLVQAGMRPWLDKWNLIPGEPWQEAIEETLDTCQVVAVFLGPNGIGPWENEEMRSALEERARDKSRRVIPVLLSGAQMPEQGSLPRFLRRLTWVDFRNGPNDAEAFRCLVSGIKGEPPGPTDGQA